MVETMEGVIVVAATNRPEMIDPALSEVVASKELHIPPPDTDSRKEILEFIQRYAIGKFLFDDLGPLDNYTGADIESICREAGLISMRAGKISLEEGFEEAIARVRPTITDEMMEYYGRMEGMLTSGLESVRRRPDTLSGIEAV